MALLDAANEIEMVLSLEVATCDRTDILSDKRMNNCITLIDHVGLPGMAETLRGIRDNPPPRQTAFQKGVRMSFKINAPQPKWGRDASR